MTENNKEIRIDYLIAAVLLFLMAAIAFANVVSRYVFHFSFASTEEITINMFVWMTVVGGGIAFERGGQLGMVTFFNMFPRALKKGSILLSAFLTQDMDRRIVIKDNSKPIQAAIERKGNLAVRKKVQEDLCHTERHQQLYTLHNGKRRQGV